MAPLWVTDFASFNAQLQTAKEYGVTGVSVDVWWSQVEINDNVFTWTEYDQEFAAIKAHGLKINPILSFHQCGGNPGDTCEYYLAMPGWLANKYQNSTLNGVTLGLDGLKYQSEYGTPNSETIQVWADPLVQNEYADFTTAFVNRYGAAYANDVDGIDVSLGSASELRYPSYSGKDPNSGFPNRGSLQSYSDLAKADFRATELAKYSTLAGVNAAWGTSLTSTASILPPQDHDIFFTSGAYRNSQYGKDFIDWYNGSLVKHGKTVLNTVAAALGSAFPNATLGYKIPGVHWAMTNPSFPRAAEVSAGLIQTSVDTTSDATGHGYANSINLANQITTNRKVVVHFTCLEMSNDGSAPNYSRAQDLVFWVAKYAATKGIRITGENALATSLNDNQAWDNIVNAFDWAPYVGLDVLRLGDVTSGGVAEARYAAFVARYTQTVTVHYAEPGPASGYTLHTWNGMTADLPMTYEGLINGKQWWKVTVQGIPTFNFCFVSSNGVWDGTNRWYSANSSQIYVLNNSTNVAITRP